MKLKDKIVLDLEFVFKNTSIKKIDNMGFDPTSPMEQRWSEEGSFEIKQNQNANKRLLKIIDYILKDKSHNLKIKESNLRGKLKDILFETHLSKARDRRKFLHSKTKDFLKELKRYGDFIFFFRVHNLTSVKKINFGKISILPSEKSFKAQVKSNLKKDAKFLTSLKINYSSSCCVMLKITENKEFAETKAREELKKHLSMLSLISGCALFLDGEISEAPEQSKYLNNGNLGSHMANPFAKFLANPLHLKNFLNKSKQHRNFFYLSSRILKNENFRLNNKIILSSEWYLEFIKELSLEQKILKLVICLETLLIEKERIKKATLAERIAFLLYDKKNHREKVYSMICEFYELRNSIVHAGKLDGNIRESFITEISHLFKLEVSKILTKKFKSIEDIDKFVENEKFK